jgi:hypothetical protein
MKLKLALFTLIMLATLTATIIPTIAGPPSFTTPIKQAQFQWRGWNPQPVGAWTPLYQNSVTSADYTLTGKVLHTTFSYSPVVTDLTGESTIYTYDKKLDLWIQKEGTMSYKYTPYYGDYPAVNYWRGYLEFDGTPAEDSFVHGVAYQWVYIYSPEDEQPTLPYSWWDEKMEAWLVGYSIYLWDENGDTQAYSMDYAFVEPVPANDFNPLDL